MQGTSEYSQARLAAVTAYGGSAVYANGVTAGECFGYGYDAGAHDASRNLPYWTTGNPDWDAGYRAAVHDHTNGNLT